ncbi:hypothetical protein RhiXN_11905 [Rhizoctonia solani]|uniref:Uncharacterized protein n=1 Tax=Rhizoctonia solani TaxID=456999 RepID=A0A8H8T2D8_9AGAM|nr:uncharacterized protein RhiXN_11905 [Rhizoctonia solani]QRW26244.1 hypothetical protein RhiXN_11905 [Rhizoctonia solani]
MVVLIESACCTTAYAYWSKVLKLNNLLFTVFRALAASKISTMGIETGPFSGNGNVNGTICRSGIGHPCALHGHQERLMVPSTSAPATFDAVKDMVVYAGILVSEADVGEAVSKALPEPGNGASA